MRTAADIGVATIIFVSTLGIFYWSPVGQIADSNYSMLLSQSPLSKHTFTLDSYVIPGVPDLLGASASDRPYQLEWVDGHVYYRYPPGTSVLSAPFVAVMNSMGVSPANGDRTYNFEGEKRIQRTLAAS